MLRTRARRGREYAPRHRHWPGPKARFRAALAEQHDWIYATVGIIPTKQRKSHRSTEELERLAAIRKSSPGEIGLDYSTIIRRATRQRVFPRPDGSRGCAKKPIIIHGRDALDRLPEH